MPVLLLGGTAEARELAALLHPRVDIVSSLAGRVPDPALPVGPVRVGGFGGPAGLREWLGDNGITAVIDATHPYSATMTANAAAACSDLGLPHLVLNRPAWDPAGSLQVASNADAADLIADRERSRVFLTTGRSGVAAFRRSDAWFLIRVVTAPEPAALPAGHRLLLSRGPYRYRSERALMADHRIEVLVTKNSGGEMTRAKIDAARDLGVEVVMITRPPLPDGLEVAASAREAVEWLVSLGSAAG